MKFTLSAQLSPSGRPFGVPQDKYIVVHAGTGHKFYSQLLTHCWKKSLITAPYRFIDVTMKSSGRTLKLDELNLRFSDNYVFIEVESDNAQDALSRCLEFLETISDSAFYSPTPPV
jgi:hypothetical protein